MAIKMVIEVSADLDTETQESFYTLLEKIIQDTLELVSFGCMTAISTRIEAEEEEGILNVIERRSTPAPQFDPRTDYPERYSDKHGN